MSLIATWAKVSLTNIFRIDNPVDRKTICCLVVKIEQTFVYAAVMILYVIT